MAEGPSRYEHTRCFRRGWVFERIGWIAMAATMIATAAGLFGNGLLSRSEATAGEALTLRYPRFCRAQAPHDLVIEWLPRREEATLWFSRSYLDDFEIQEIRPTPAAVIADAERIYYTFRAREPRARVGVRFTLKPEHGGSFRGRIGSDDELNVEVRQFVFP